MAVGTREDHTILEIVQSHLDDTTAKMLKADEVNRIIYKHVQKEQSWTFEKKVDNIYTSGYEPTLWLYNMSDLTLQDNIAYKLYSEGGSIVGTSIAITGTTTGDTSATVLIDSTAAFITDGAAVGDIVTNSTTSGSPTAVIVSVDSETQITTASITDSWDNGDSYSVATTVVDIRSTITLNGSRVDFGKIMWEIDGKLIDKLAHRTPSSTGSSNYDPQRAIETLRERRGEWLGVRPLSGGF